MEDEEKPELEIELQRPNLDLAEVAMRPAEIGFKPKGKDESGCKNGTQDVTRFLMYEYTERSLDFK